MSTIREYVLVKIGIDPDLSVPSVHNSGSLYGFSITGGWPTVTLVFCVEKYNYKLYVNYTIYITLLFTQ